MPGPIIGYVGNLSARIDLALLDDDRRAPAPHWQFVFVGSAHFDQSILRLDALPNVHFVGVKPYEEAQAVRRATSTSALIPHLDNEMTRSMNPLKAYVYLAAGVPVVSTPIANLGELADNHRVGHLRGRRRRVLAAIEDAAARGETRSRSRGAAPAISWPAQASTR